MTRATVGAMLAVALCATAAHAQTVGAYRAYRLGADLTSVAALAGLTPEQAVTRHLQPALLQELEWRKSYVTTGPGSSAATDPVRAITFSFYDNALFRMAVDYDQERTTGLTDADFVESFSAVYGAPIAAARKAGADLDQASGTPIARWGDDDFAVVLYRGAFSSGMKLTVTATPAAALARTAEAASIELEHREAPQREAARQKKDADDALAATAKARLANRPTFAP